MVPKMEKAVAVEYTGELLAPIIVAKGKGELARRVKAIAEQNQIKIVELPELADVLVELDVGSFIPEKFYAIMAEILIFVRDSGM